ncbi:phage tail-like protein [Kibdelosporangium banguiense]|uniref:Phage tail-like protein n=1 Tax=Kibdelosporangium banguiense TaxID=1365924 RepID=A0ABS4TKJ0_9PSEU|nr:phage tail protein [Kibdelosporangium banguiense]MBP2324839.1 phage tail-like protein [Kibdelosporangium banguiense]
MSRAALAGLPSRHPLGTLLPSMYASDDFAQRFTAGLDAVLAAIISTLDNLPAYVDARLAPDDFLTWLASWVAADVDPSWPVELRRVVVRHAVELHRWQGTARGLVERLRLCFGVHAEVIDGAGAIWSATPGTELPGEATTEVVVRVWPGDADQARVVAMVEAVCPVHVTCRVEMLPGPPRQEGE